MTSLFKRLDQEETVVRGELAALRERIAVVEERLAHLTITRETLLSLAVEEYANQGDDVSQGKADCRQDGTQPFGALAVPAGETGYLLRERPTWALGVPAPEPPDPQLEYDASSGARDISEKPQVGAVNPGRADSASRAVSAGRGALRVKAHVLDIHVHRPHRDVRDRREQQLLQTEYNVFHGPDCQPSCTDRHPFSRDFAYRPETLSRHSPWPLHESCARTRVGSGTTSVQRTR